MKSNSVSNRSTSVRSLFRLYYNTKFKEAKLHLNEVKFRHFRLELFSGKTHFARIKDIFRSETELKNRISKVIPKNAYHTPVKWLNPIYVAKSRTEIDVMLSSPLFFDIDLDLKTTNSFSTAKESTMKLVEFIEDNYSRTPDLIVFSGRQGFHLYFWDWDFHELVHLSPRERIERFIIERKRILKELATEAITVDPRVTADPYRLMKIPNTLHGKTGLIASPIDQVSSFDPSVQSRAFDRSHYSEVFNIDLEFYES